MILQEKIRKTEKSMMKIQIWGVCCFLILYHFVSRRVNANNFTVAESVHSYIFDNYDKDISPIYSNTLMVYVSMYLFSIVDFDEIAGTITIMGGLYYTWIDKRLIWDPSRYGNLEVIVVPSEKVWVPDIYYLNPADYMIPIGSRYFKNRVYSNGAVLRNVGSIMKTTCDVDITYFPFDEQTCEIDFYTYGYDASEIYLQITRGQVDMSDFRPNSQWKVQSAILKRKERSKLDGAVTAVLVLDRHPEYFTVNILIPVLFLCLLNPVVFLLPAESGERISFTATIYLSLAVFMTLVNDNMPKSSKPLSRLSMFLILMIASSTVLCILAITITKIYFRDDSLPVPNWMIQVLHLMKFKWCARFMKKNKVQSSGNNNDGGTPKPLGDDNKCLSKKEILLIPEDFQDVIYENKDKGKDGIDQNLEKFSWKQLSREMDKVAFGYSVFFLIVMFTLFIVVGLRAY